MIEVTLGPVLGHGYFDTEEGECPLCHQRSIEPSEWHCKCGASFVSGRGLAGHIGGKSRWITNSDHGRTGPAPFAPDPQGATPRAEGLETPQEGNAP